ncbi:uncharacterized protein LOC119742541 [Patiria miniata]|uniref:Insulin-like domain-containing protein n=1 Tax=Patiria miniata TaxID=46514 RepID=A0A913ZGV6_PATMI|nr:uncharacterized protein LOC119724160 [Patiria miniata]XP_038074482.1 uncharacterized protein LOC119742541 [Patiria miniata]
MNRFIALLLICAFAVAIAEPADFNKDDKIDDLDIEDDGQLETRKPHYCGHRLLRKYAKICHHVTLHRRPHHLAANEAPSAFVESDEANSFLDNRGISKRGLHEECCHEGCSNREVRKHC